MKPKWKCTGCLLSWDDSLLQCGACEAVKPGVDKDAIDNAKRDLASLFTGTGPSSKKVKPDDSFTFGTSASSSAAPASGAAPAFSFGAGGFSFLTKQDSGNYGFSESIAQQSQAPSFGAGFSFNANAAVDDKNRTHARKNKKTADISASLPRGNLRGDIFVHGSGECEQLGLGANILERKKPSIMKSIRAVTQISVGCLHVLAVTEDGKVYSWGCNDDGALGRPGAENEPHPVDFPGRATKVSAGGSHSGFIDSDGNVWQCGSFKDSNGQIGFPDFAAGAKVSVKDKKCVKPVQIPAIHNATQLSSGVDFSICMAGSLLFSWGDNLCGQLGQGFRTPEQPAATGNDERDERNLQEWKRKKVECLFPALVSLPSTTISKIGTGSDYTFLVTKDKETYACGLNGDFQLGIGRRSEAEANFQLIEGLRGLDVVEISGGSSHSVARTADGHVYVWGRMDRCGVDSTLVSGIEKPQRLPQEAFCNSDIVSAKAACGGAHTVALSREGDVYLWGSGDVNQLGNCPRDVNDFTEEERRKDAGDDEKTPYLLTSKALAGRYVFAAGVGAQHTVLLAWSQDDPAPKRTTDDAEYIPTKRRRIDSIKVEVSSPAIFVEALEHVWQLPQNAVAFTRGYF